ncbi:surface antigen BspA-like [Trichomonas vaginalis G3]|uniref:Surface antigen BspA-like n=1 Tax=Trichomonas vaginalis (strain ATCC PRA-98 / G3) TaxID=412133 RepID=A2DKH4_TRIV3|nr:antigen BSP-related family [Trichomonas vaginalis G3]EAY19151.1 surface antigen BspA-like [Trichomonas vaginalis G3]KAI5490449.1 antigen BSP-related family [Trichomonas vaginalis G3]|eukprot:XP_001580137.1 surface antigen BspA-like [Trichomonas vaginalis G3]
MIVLIIAILLSYKDINSSCYSSDLKTLNKVTDSSPDLRISATCEIISNNCFKNLKTLNSFSFGENPNLTTIGQNSFKDCINLKIVNLSSCTKLTTISFNAFSDCSNVTEVLLPEGLKEIQNSAFSSNSIISITIPSTVETIGSNAFSSCSKLESVIFQEGSNLTSLENSVFSGTNITSFEIPQNVNQIDLKAFDESKLTNITVNLSNNYFTIEDSILFSKNKSILYFSCNKSIETFEIPASVTILTEYCFSRLSSLKSFSFGENPNLTIIGKESFKDCINLEIINLSSCTKLTTIFNDAFSGCSKVTEILLPKGLKVIQNYAFRINSLVTTVRIPSSVEKLNDGAFEDCSNLTNIIFEEGSNLTSLEDFIFSGTEITSFEIPQNVKEIKVDAFSASKITHITIKSSNPYFSIENNTLFSKNKSILYFVLNKSLENFEIPDSVTTLGEKCFNGLKFFSITIPSNVKRIENYAFNNCNNLINVTFLGSLEFIGNDIFYNCKNLELITFPNSSMIVNGNLFISSNNKKAAMSFTHKTLFSSDAIQRIIKVSVSYLNEHDLIITTNALIMKSNQTIIYEYWGYNISDITIPNTVKNIKSNSFENSTISSINFDQNSQPSVIEDYAFRNCTNLKAIEFSSSNSITLGKSTFENCINLEKAINILNISDHCFSECTNLRQVTIREDAKYIGFKSFENCISLKSISIPSTVETISEYSFLNCNNLESITFSEQNNLTTFEINSISECKSLQNISNFKSNKYKCIDNTLYSINDTKLDLIYHLSQSKDSVLVINCSVIRKYSFNNSNTIVNISILSNTVSLIESYSFNNCLNLKYINFPLCVETIGRNAFNECISILCPQHIENKTTIYFQMIIDSGIKVCLRSQNFDEQIIFSKRFIRR